MVTELDKREQKKNHPVYRSSDELLMGQKEAPILYIRRAHQPRIESLLEKVETAAEKKKAVSNITKDFR